MRLMMAAVAGLALMAGSVGGQAPAGAPAGATGICKDGTYWTGTVKSGACRGHKGIQTWYADAGGGSAAKPGVAAAAPEAAAAGKTKSMPAPTAAPSVASRPAPTPAASAPAMPAPATASTTSAASGAKKGPAAAAAAKPQAPGGGAGLVWLNTDSNVYHCNGSVYYGKTKAGQYMSEADAKAKGAHGDRGKTCEGK